MSIPYKNLFQAFFFATVLFLLTNGCASDCESCEPKLLQPFARVLLINNDSLTELNSLKDSLSDLGDSLTTIRRSVTSEINILSDSLEDVQAAIDTGNFTYVPIRDDLEALVSQLNDSLDGVGEQISISRERLSDFQAIATVITSGLVKVEEIINLENGESISFEDSLADYQIPLDMSGNFVSYGVVIEDRQYIFDLNYTLEETINVRREFRLTPMDLSVASYSNFDTVYFNDQNILTCLF